LIDEAYGKQRILTFIYLNTQTICKMQEGQAKGCHLLMNMRLSQTRFKDEDAS